MTQTPFEQFIMLVQVDQKINSLNATIASLTKENAQIVLQDAANKQALDVMKNKFHDIRKEVDAKELEMKTLDQQEADKKKRLENVANHKEYQSIKSEIDKIKKAQHDLEQVLVDAWNQAELAKKELEGAVKNYEQQEQTANQNKEKNNQHIEQINGEIATLMADRVQKEKGIPEEWLQKYAVMRSRVTDPVVPVVDGSCSACFYKVSAQDMQALKHRKLMQCKDCFRLLYLPEAQLKNDAA